MKLFKFWKSRPILSTVLNNEQQFFLYINGVKLENVKVHATRSHHDTYKILRTLRTPQYQDIFLFRNKKGFNTFNFNQKYDVIITGRNGVVLDLLTDVSENIISKKYNHAHYIFFATVGTIKFYDLKIKDICAVTKDWLK